MTGLTLEDFDYELPPERIAQSAVEPRDAARMMVIDRISGALRDHARVADLPSWLEEGDLVIGNATRVDPARLRGRKASGGKAEALLLGPAESANHYLGLVRCRGRLREGLELVFERDGEEAAATVVGLEADGRVLLRFESEGDPYRLGEMPLPPYIQRHERNALDDGRYQTVFARSPGSVAAPTAGLHVTEELLTGLAARGVAWSEVVLHVGVGTFRPLSDTILAEGRLHAEHYELPQGTADAIAAARARGGRVIAIGTTTCRVLETCGRDEGQVEAGTGETTLFLRPGDSFRVIDGLLTNFHLPQSSLLFLVAAFMGRDELLARYQDAIDEAYRFYSYGDAMLLL